MEKYKLIYIFIILLSYLIKWQLEGLRTFMKSSNLEQKIIIKLNKISEKPKFIYFHISVQLFDQAAACMF